MSYVNGQRIDDFAEAAQEMSRMRQEKSLSQRLEEAKELFDKAFKKAIQAVEEAKKELGEK